jgi:ornithine cyclodeaminase
MSHPDLLYVPYADTLDLLSVEDAMRICEDVYRMHARGSVEWSNPPSQRMDVGAPFHNHWHVKGALLKDIPITGLRFYNYYDDGLRNTVGYLECFRYILLADPHTGHGLAMVDEHWSYAVRSTAAAVLPCKWLGPAHPRVLGLVGVGTMGTNALRCLLTLYRFEEIRCTSRRAETREAFAREWSEKLGIPVRACATNEEVARGADIVVGGTTSSDIMCRAEWLKPGSVFISLARRELDPAGWASMDKIVLDSFDLNLVNAPFREMLAQGQFSREAMHAEIHEVVTGAKPGRAHEAERILIHTTGLVSQDIALCHAIYERAKAQGRYITLPAARPR